MSETTAEIHTHCQGASRLGAAARLLALAIATVCGACGTRTGTPPPLQGCGGRAEVVFKDKPNPQYQRAFLVGELPVLVRRDSGRGPGHVMAIGLGCTPGTSWTRSAPLGHLSDLGDVAVAGLGWLMVAPAVEGTDQPTFSATMATTALGVQWGPLATGIGFRARVAKFGANWLVVGSPTSLSAGGPRPQPGDDRPEVLEIEATGKIGRVLHGTNGSGVWQASGGPTAVAVLMVGGVPGSGKLGLRATIITGQGISLIASPASPVLSQAFPGDAGVAMAWTSQGLRLLTLEDGLLVQQADMTNSWKKVLEIPASEVGLGAGTSLHVVHVALGDQGQVCAVLVRQQGAKDLEIRCWSVDGARGRRIHIVGLAGEGDAVMVDDATIMGSHSVWVGSVWRGDGTQDSWFADVLGDHTADVEETLEVKRRGP